MNAPTFTDILDAKRAIDRYLQPTPLYQYPTLSALSGFETFIKHENHQPIGSFKIRGGINLISRLSLKEKQAGIIGASTGNHGQSIAYAAKLFGVQATIVVPERANPDKVAAMRAFGADVRFHGRDFDEARTWCEEQAKSLGYRYIHHANEPLLIAGVGTIGLEMLSSIPDLDAIVVPVGGGTSASGICIAAKTMNPKIRMIGVQSAHATAVYESWQAKQTLSSTVCDTFAEGIATRQAFALTLGVLIQHLDEFVLVDDHELAAGIVTLFDHTHNIAEGAGAAAIAGAIKIQDQLAGKKVAVHLSGGSITRETLRRVLT